MNEDMPPKKKRKVISLEQKLSVTYVEINDLFLKNESKTGFCCFLYRRYSIRMQEYYFQVVWVPNNFRALRKSFYSIKGFTYDVFKNWQHYVSCHVKRIRLLQNIQFIAILRRPWQHYAN